MPSRRRFNFTLPAIACCTIAALVALVIGATPPSTPKPPAVSSSSTPAARAIEKRYTDTVKPLLTRYCYDCHANGKHKGDLTLDSFDSLDSIQAASDTWQHVAEMLQQGQMPPKKQPHPASNDITTLTTWINDALDYCDCSGPRDPGRILLRRLNRTEYNNTIRDLFGIDFQPANDFPADDTGYGFDNIADLLSVSPLLTEKYLAAAEQVIDKLTENPTSRKTVRFHGNQMEAQVGQPAEGGAWNITINGEIFKQFLFGADADYEIRVHAYGEQFGKDPARMTVRFDNKDLKTFDVTAVQGKSDTYTLRIPIKAGAHRLAFAYINNLVDRDNPDPKKRGDRNLVVESVSIDGPISSSPLPQTTTELQRRIFFVSPGKDLSDEQCAKQILQRFIARAFRRSSTNDDVEKYLKLYRQARTHGDNHVQALKVPLVAVLVSPGFLFHIELDPLDKPKEIHPVSDYELASRLSYFLWNSMPDDALFIQAQSGKLRQPEVLRATVQRMLANPKSSSFVDNFLGQWLELRKLEDASPDPIKFPKFNLKLKQAIDREPRLFLENIIHDDRSVLELLDSDYTFVNETLAKHYGIPDVTGDDFRKVSLAGTHRGGVLTMAGVLTVTAMPNRTSPVRRGKFVLEAILGTPPPPPPPNVPPLSEKPRDINSATLRQRLSSHRADPSCAMCHERMDPIGFVLENFDAVGAWRDKDGNFPIDSSDTLSGQKINGPDELRRFLVSRKREFLNCLVQKMLTYALGRGVDSHDRCTVKDICQACDQNNDRFSALIMAIVESDAFQKRNPGAR